MSKVNRELLPTFGLLAIIALLMLLNIEYAPAIKFDKQDIIYDKSANTVYLNSMSLRQKIAQMVVVWGKDNDAEIFQKMNVGGIHLGSRTSKEDFIKSISLFQENMKIPFLFTVDMEGCGNPFENFKKFPSLREIKTKENAYAAGYEQGRLLKEIGFTINFAPVVELEDNIWKCRTFSGTPEDISEKAVYYIKGLQENGIIATAKHYPGKTLESIDPHVDVIHVNVNKQDILPFEAAISNDVGAIMVTHSISSGLIDSDSKPAVSSQKLIKGLRSDFDGLVITDDIRMGGLRKFYDDNEKMYIDIFKADNDIIIYFAANPEDINKMILSVENAVNEGIISEERIDKSVIKILNAKGIRVV